MTPLVLALALLFAEPSVDSGPRFEGKDTLLRPQGYREWVFVGSSLGLRYDPGNRGQNLYHNVYINPTAYREFARTGKFPEGTMLVLELASSAEKNEPGLKGSYQERFVALEATVKDKSRLADGWAYFSFDSDPARARPFPRERCFECHNAHAATDNVFTQFYPVLRDVMKKER